jgi:predicted enzyme related to lactoylglutathione lyase
VTVAARFDLVTFDSPAPDSAAAFWCEVLHLHETEREDGDRWIVLSDGDGRRRIGVQRGSVRPGTVHLDLVCSIDEFDDERSRLMGCGAAELAPARAMEYGRIANLADPDGNPFDLCAYV